MKSISVCSYLIFPSLLRAREGEMLLCTDGNTEAQGGELTYPRKRGSQSPWLEHFPLYWSLTQRFKNLGSKLIHRQ